MIRIKIQLPNELYDKIIYFEKEYYTPRFEIIRRALRDYTDNFPFECYEEEEDLSDYHLLKFSELSVRYKHDK